MSTHVTESWRHSIDYMQQLLSSFFPMWHHCLSQEVESIFSLPLKFGWLCELHWPSKCSRNDIIHLPKWGFMRPCNFHLQPLQRSAETATWRSKSHLLEVKRPQEGKQRYSGNSQHQLSDTWMMPSGMLQVCMNKPRWHQLRSHHATHGIRRNSTSVL